MLPVLGICLFVPAFAFLVACESAVWRPLLGTGRRPSLLPSCRDFYRPASTGLLPPADIVLLSIHFERPGCSGSQAHMREAVVWGMPAFALLHVLSSSCMIAIGLRGAPGTAPAIDSAQACSGCLMSDKLVATLCPLQAAPLRRASGGSWCRCCTF